MLPKCIDRIRKRFQSHFNPRNKIHPFQINIVKNLVARITVARITVVKTTNPRVGCVIGPGCIDGKLRGGSGVNQVQQMIELLRDIAQRFGG